MLIKILAHAYHFVDKNADKDFIIFLFLVVLGAFIFDPDPSHAETYKPLLSGLAGCLFGMVKGGLPAAPVTTTKTDTGDGATTETKTETK